MKSVNLMYCTCFFGWNLWMKVRVEVLEVIFNERITKLDEKWNLMDKFKISNHNPRKQYHPS